MVVPLRTVHRVLVACVCLVTATAVAQPGSGTKASGEPLYCDGNPVSDYVAGRREVPQLLPVDEAPREPDLVALRRTLIEAVNKRDVSTIVESASEDIVLGFEGERGPAEFRSLIASGHIDFWTEFGRVLAMGGRFEDGAFVAPYVTSAWEYGSDCNRAVVSRRVRLRARPSLAAPVLAMLDYDVVEESYFSSVDGRRMPLEIPTGWGRVRIATGIVGYVSQEFLRSPLDYRVHFERRAGRWRIIAFVAGD